MAKVDELKVLLDPVVTGLGYVFWGVEYASQGKHSTLRVFIDHEDGINVDQCAEVSHQISAVMDVEDPIAQNYTLEVSSPGMDRPLFTLEQYAAYIGEWVNVRLRAPFEGRRKFKGVLTAIEDQDVCVTVDGTDYLLPIESIEKANLIPNFDKK
ncbi:ribosome maturation factor RimP [Saccharospirillum salsuginis]|uniref:Ribosome maturation factor RimP n=1 Tax=Saccharospirillum salsuginis TaxID=418750 RepID=A0A918K1T2_9GAMM|nr:ribosome maturation factor RimP [Saccharospirillum salsuginis]GGX44801.1 ribosome maturation factor RimP [Saccharospirillum salsuginis]